MKEINPPEFIKDIKFDDKDRRIILRKNRPVTHLERLWYQNISITIRLVDTISTPFLLIRKEEIRSKKSLSGLFDTV
jgi:hypothetical protein